MQHLSAMNPGTRGADTLSDEPAQKRARAEAAPQSGAATQRGSVPGPWCDCCQGHHSSSGQQCCAAATAPQSRSGAHSNEDAAQVMTKRGAQRVCKWCHQDAPAWLKGGRCRECDCLKKRIRYAFEAQGLWCDMGLIRQTILALGQDVLCSELWGMAGKHAAARLLGQGWACGGGGASAPAVRPG